MLIGTKLSCLIPSEVYKLTLASNVKILEDLNTGSNGYC